MRQLKVVAGSDFANFFVAPRLDAFTSLEIALLSGLKEHRYPHYGAASGGDDLLYCSVLPLSTARVDSTRQGRTPDEGAASAFNSSE